MVLARCCSDFTSQLRVCSFSRQEALSSSLRGRRRHAGVEASLTSTRGMVSGFSSSDPAAIRRGAHQHIRAPPAAPAPASKLAPGLGSSARISAIISREVLGIDAADRHQRRAGRAAPAAPGCRAAPASPGRAGSARQLEPPGIRAGRGRTCPPGRSASCAARTALDRAPARSPSPAAIAGARPAAGRRHRPGRSAAPDQPVAAGRGS